MSDAQGNSIFRVRRAWRCREREDEGESRRRGPRPASGRRERVDRKGGREGGRERKDCEEDEGPRDSRVRRKRKRRRRRRAPLALPLRSV